MNEKETEPIEPAEYIMALGYIVGSFILNRNITPKNWLALRDRE